MCNRCKAFPSEYGYEFNNKGYAKRDLYRPILNWSTEEGEETKSLDINNEELLQKFILDRLKTVYQRDYKINIDENENPEDLDLGNELVNYVNNLYHNAHPKKTPALQYTASRVFGYASPRILRGELSSYQDNYGRTGGEIILRNVQKVIRLNHRRAILAKLSRNTEEKNNNGSCT